MNDIIRGKAEKWNTRFSSCLQNSKFNSQDAFIKAFNKKYGTKCTQKDVSRWLHVGEQKKETDKKSGEEKIVEIGFPNYSNMILIADFFDVDVGYLTGETDAESFTCQDASKYMGLTPSAIEAVRKATTPRTKKSHRFSISRTSLDFYGFIPEIFQKILNKLFTEEKFWGFVESLYQLDEVYNKSDKETELEKKLNKKYSDNIINDAIYAIEHQYENYPDPEPELPEIVINAIHDIQDIEDHNIKLQQAKEHNLCVYRYKLSQAFEELALAMYPK